MYNFNWGSKDIRGNNKTKQANQILSREDWEGWRDNSQNIAKKERTKLDYTIGEPIQAAIL